MERHILGNGIYTFAEAARLTAVSSQRVRAWFTGWPRGLGPALHTDYYDLDTKHKLISFLDLVEVLVAGKLRERGVSLLTIRKAHLRLAEQLKTEHPFSHSDLLTDGRAVFVRTANTENDPQLIDLLKNQLTFDSILRPYLDRIEWDEGTHLALRWRIVEGIVIDPAIRFGKPVVLDCAMPTAVLATAYRANCGDTNLVADWYGVNPNQVELAVSFEANISGKAA